MIIFCWEKSITTGSEDMMEESSLEKMAEREPKLAPSATVIRIPFHTDSMARLIFLLPTFWLRL